MGLYLSIAGLLPGRISDEKEEEEPSSMLGKHMCVAAYDRENIWILLMFGKYKLMTLRIKIVGGKDKEKGFVLVKC